MGYLPLFTFVRSRCQVKVLLMPSGARSRHPVIDHCRQVKARQRSDSQGFTATGQFYVTRPEGPDIANGAPVGAPSPGHVEPGYQACTFTAVVGGRWSAPRSSIWRSCGHYSPATARLPRLVARGYPAAVYGPAVRDSFLLGFRSFEKPAA